MKKKIYAFLFLFFAAAAIVSAYHLISSELDYKNATEYYNTLADTWTKPKESAGVFASAGEKKASPAPAGILPSPSPAAETARPETAMPEHAVPDPVTAAAQAELPAETPAAGIVTEELPSVSMPSESSVETPAEAFAAMLSESPAGIPAEASADVSAESPAEAPAEATAGIPVESPAEAPAETAAELPAAEPAQVLTEIPAETSIETSVDMQAGAAADGQPAMHPEASALPGAADEKFISEAAVTKHTTTELPPIAADFEGLHAVNPEIVGWIYCEGTNINYPVLQAKNNDKYLRTQPDGKRAGSGSIFIDFACNRDFSSDNTIVYGHNLKNGMFSSLSHYQEQEYYEEHPLLWLLTPEQNYRIDLFAGFVSKPDDFVYTIGFADEHYRSGFIESCLASSCFTSSNIPFPEDKMITLSTCNYSFQDARFVVVGILVPVCEE